ADRRTDKPKASTLQGLAHPVRFLGSCRDLLQGSPTASFRSTLRETPDVRVEAPELLLHNQQGFGILDGGCDLRSVPDDAGVGQEALDLLRSEEHTSELQSRGHLVCRLLLEKKKKQYN